jgi:outer membrane usher protein FimD/PapC
MSQAGIVGDAGVVSLNKLPQKGELDVIRHHVWGALNVAFLHKDL